MGLSRNRACCMVVVSCFRCPGKVPSHSIVEPSHTAGTNEQEEIVNCLDSDVCQNAHEKRWECESASAIVFNSEACRPRRAQTLCAPPVPPTRS